MLEHRFANELPDRFKSLADELVASNVDVLIGVGSSAAPYAKNATTTIPVVFTLVADPIGSKLVDSLQQPGGNVTGLSSFSPDLFGKHLQILKEIIPSLARVALLVNPNDESSRLFMDGLQAAAAELGLTSQNFEWRTTNDLGPAFDAMKRAGIQVFTSNPDGLAFAQRALIGQIALARNLPLSVWSKEALKPGAFMSYAVDQDAICQRTAVFVDKISQGCQTRRAPGGAADKNRALHQPQDRQDVWARRARAGSTGRQLRERLSRFTWSDWRTGRRARACHRPPRRCRS